MPPVICGVGRIQSLPVLAFQSVLGRTAALCRVCFQLWCPLASHGSSHVLLLTGRAYVYFIFNLGLVSTGIDFLLAPMRRYS